MAHMSEFDKLKRNTKLRHDKIQYKYFRHGQNIDNLKNTLIEEFGTNNSSILNNIRGSDEADLQCVFDACENAQQLYDVLGIVSSIFDINVYDLRTDLYRLIHSNNETLIIKSLSDIHTVLISIAGNQVISVKQQDKILENQSKLENILQKISLRQITRI